jgi:hypothetical protein
VHPILAPPPPTGRGWIGLSFPLLFRGVAVVGDLTTPLAAHLAASPPLSLPFSAPLSLSPRPSPLLSPAYPFRPASPPPTIEVLPTLLSSLHRLARGLDLGFLSVSRVDPVGGALGALVGGWVSEGEGILGLARV